MQTPKMRLFDSLVAAPVNPNETLLPSVVCSKKLEKVGSSMATKGISWNWSKSVLAMTSVLEGSIGTLREAICPVALLRDPAPPAVWAVMEV